MAILDIIKYPHPGLHRVAQPVKAVDDQIRTMLDNMLETMYAAPGIGLAANQVDFYQRIVTIDVSEHKDTPLFLINPEIIKTSGTEEMEEGCLSIPGIYEKVTRPAEVSIKALDRDGKEFTLDADGLLAVCIQHEIDHLNGILFIDHLSMLKRQRIHRKLMKEKRRAAAEATE